MLIGLQKGGGRVTLPRFEHGLQELKGLDSGLTQKSLKKMLKGNKVTEFDPVAEAFKLLDPKSEGHVDMSVVRELFRGMGMGELTKDELNVITGMAIDEFPEVKFREPPDPDV